MPAPRLFKGKTPFTTNYQDDFCFNRGYLVDQAKVAPIEPGRRNNPHPHEDFVNLKGKMAKVDPKVVKEAVREYMDNLMTASRRTYDDYTPYIQQEGKKPVVMKSHVPKTKRGLTDSVMYPTSTEVQILGQYANDRNQRTLQTDTGKDDYVAYTPMNLKPKSEQPHWIVWKSGATPEPRSTVYEPPPLRPRAPAPPVDMYSGEEGFTDDTHEALNDQEPCFQDIPGKQADGYSTYVPGFRSWVSGGQNNYDKEVVYNMLKRLDGAGRSGDLRHMHRSYSATQPKLEGHQTRRSAQSAGGRYEHPINFERRAINTMFKNLGTHPWMYGFSGYSRHLDYGPNALLYRNYQPERRSYSDIMQGFEHLNNGQSFSTDYTLERPTVRRMYRQPPMKNYAHENSFFLKTKAPTKSHFIINPEWVSENKTHRKNLAHMRSGPNSLRYGSK